MAGSWQSWCRGGRMTVDGDQVLVGFDNERSHRVRVEETAETIEFRAVVATAGVARQVEELELRLWRHNRNADLVSFSLDKRDRVVGHGWVPKAGLEAEEFQRVLRHVAAESDRLEFLLTGRDVE
jgi:hypothetical protein